MKKLRITVAGGSLGGLFAAILLRQDGHEVRVFERSAGGLEGRGAGLVPQREVFDVLRAIGAEDAVTIGVVARDRITLDCAGGIAHRQATPQMQVSWDYLYSAVRARLGDGEYRLGRAVQSATQAEAGAVLHFTDGSDEAADLVLGADGIGSVLRRIVTGEPSPNRYAGYVAWRGLVPEAALPQVAVEGLLDRFAFFMLPGSHILGYSVTGPGGRDATRRPALQLGVVSPRRRGGTRRRADRCHRACACLFAVTGAIAGPEVGKTAGGSAAIFAAAFRCRRGCRAQPIRPGHLRL
jgi:2-polyprenyl-6-methoxyphenol hydroxylase-like FAD-dependent oxidoreductase